MPLERHDAIMQLTGMAHAGPANLIVDASRRLKILVYQDKKTLFFCLELLDEENLRQSPLVHVTHQGNKPQFSRPHRWPSNSSQLLRASVSPWSFRPPLPCAFE